MAHGSFQNALLLSIYEYHDPAREREKKIYVTPIRFSRLNADVGRSQMTYNGPKKGKRVMAETEIWVKGMAELARF